MATLALLVRMMLVMPHVHFTGFGTFTKDGQRMGDNKDEPKHPYADGPKYTDNELEQLSKAKAMISGIGPRLSTSDQQV